MNWPLKSPVQTNNVIAVTSTIPKLASRGIIGIYDGVYIMLSCVKKEKRASNYLINKVELYLMFLCCYTASLCSSLDTIQVRNHNHCLSYKIVF